MKALFLRPFVLLLLALFTMPLTGCGLYINIPGQQSDVAVNSAHWAPVKEVITDSINKTVERYGLMMQPYTLSIIEGQRGWLFDDGTSIFDKIAPNVIGNPIPDHASQTPLVEVLKIRIRGSDAEVDMYASPEADRLGDTFTVYLSWSPGASWRVDRIRVWRGGIEPDLRHTPAPRNAADESDTPTQPTPKKQPPRIEKLDV